MTVIKVACVQNCASDDFQGNLEALKKLTAQAAEAGAQLVAWPEFATSYAIDDGGVQVAPHPMNDHPALHQMRAISRSHQIWLLAGSIGVTAPDGRTCNRSVLLNPNGELVSHYDKIHLFDVDLAGGESYRESDAIAPGSQAVIADLLGTRLGMTICYDVRFAYLYRQLAHAGAGLLAVPAAFARKTGQAHWHVLLRARAIETGCFVIAPCQSGEQADGRLKRYGHSLIISPWGEVLAEGDALNEDVILADLDLAEVAKARSMVPALHHDREIQPPGMELAAE